MSQRDSAKPAAYRTAAKRLGVSAATVRGDLDTLIAVGDEFKPWLSSLSVAILAEGFVVESRGSFRRPFRLTAEEALALLIGLTGVRGGSKVAKKLGTALQAAPPAETVERAYGLGPAPSAQIEGVLALARQARDEKRKLELHYCGLSGEPARRVVQVHQVVQHRGTWYVVAW